MTAPQQQPTPPAPTCQQAMAALQALADAAAQAPLPFAAHQRNAQHMQAVAAALAGLLPPEQKGAAP